MPRSVLDELLAAVDVEGRAGDRGVGHEVDGKCRDAGRRDVDACLLLPLQVARHATSKVRPGGTLLFLGGTGGRRTTAGVAFSTALTAALAAMTRSLALEVAPVRVNLIASVHVMNRGSGAVAGSVGFGEACFRGLYAV